MLVSPAASLAPNSVIAFNEAVGYEHGYVGHLDVVLEEWTMGGVNGRSDERDMETLIMFRAKIETIIDRQPSE